MFSSFNALGSVKKGCESVDDALSAIQVALNKLRQVKEFRDEKVSQGVDKVAELHKQIEEDKKESERAARALSKFQDLVN